MRLQELITKLQACQQEMDTRGFKNPTIDINFGDRVLEQVLDVRLGPDIFDEKDDHDLKNCVIVDCTDLGDGTDEPSCGFLGC